MYSQNNEDEYIIDYFKQKPLGKFLDIGAYHPFNFSNTRRLFEMGWSGICIEPSPICFNNLWDEYKNEPLITLINRAVVADSSENTSNVKFEEIEVQTISTSQIETQYIDTVDFLNIDVESCNYNLFKSFSNNFLSKLKMLCIAHDKWDNQIKQRMQGLGFKLLYLNAENIIMVK